MTQAREGGGKRVRVVDELRGVAIALMVVYHFCFDLAWFGYIRADFNHSAFWLGFRGVILSLFLGLVGVSLHLASRRGLRWRPYFRRLCLLSLSAVLVTAVSLLIFPRSYIFFGVLHCIALSSVLALPFRSRPRLSLLCGAALVLIGQTVRLHAFDHPALQWVGMMTHKPVTEDYVPLVPWFGVVLIGLYSGEAFFRRLPALLVWEPHGWLPRVLSLAGRHSLTIYLLHQPVLFALFHLIRYFA